MMSNVVLADFQISFSVILSVKFATNAVPHFYAHLRCVMSLH